MLMRIKGIKRVTVRKGGRLYVYYRHRATGELVKAEFGTMAFAAEAAALDARAAVKEPGPGTWGAIVALYRSSEEHKALAPRTRKDYGKVFNYLETLGDMPLHTIDTGFVYDLRDKAFAHKGRRFSTYVIQVIRLTFTWARRRKKFTGDNPAENVEALRRPKNMARANRSWADSEREVVLERAPVALRTVIALGMFAGLREGDAIRLPWSAYEKSVIQSVQAKTGDPIWIPAHFRLRTVLEQAPRKSPVLAVNSRGKPWTEDGFRASFFKLLKKLELAGKVGPGLTYHGLRHTVGKLIIESGGDVKDVQAILGHRSSVMAEHYSRDADQRQRATATIKRMERTERKKMDKQADRSGQPEK